MSSAIKISGLSKCYWLNHRSAAPARTLREELTRWASAPFRRLSRRGTPADDAASREQFWALNDVSFDVEPGEVIGIIGRNGAGKSTLLKILSRITEPTRGRVEINGRVASLLEVGTGFHPELTGRENIYLNGAILGMTRSEIRAKFDEIVDFAEVAKFLDTPVKRYSSGMYVRLAFAVAAHLEPEILVVDEVLAVGDAQFQRKCLGKMQDVSTREGRTVLFVSHQMGTIRQLCTRAVLLASGSVAEVGPTAKVIDSYMAMHFAKESGTYQANASTLAREVAIERAWTSNELGEPTPHFLHTEPITVHITCRVNRWVPNVELRLVMGDSLGRRVFTSDTFLQPPSDPERGLVYAQATIPGHFLRPSTYLITLATFVNNQVSFDTVLDGLSIVIQDGGSKYAASEGIDYGCVFAPCAWRTSERGPPPLAAAHRDEGLSAG